MAPASVIPDPAVGPPILRFHEQKKELWGSEKHTTNNRMELTAAIEGLRKSLREQCEVEVVTDSEYVKNGITTWIHGWKKQGLGDRRQKACDQSGPLAGSWTNRSTATRPPGPGPRVTPVTPITIAATNLRLARPESNPKAN